MKWLALIALAGVASLAYADVQPFETGSLAKIRAAHAGRPFILGFWSLDCPHCPKELEQLGKLRQLHPKIEVVLVSTDLPGDVSALADFAVRQGLGEAEQWVFAGAQPHKLRFEIDHHWWGELPRTYLFDADHKFEAHSGLVGAEIWKRWLDRNSIDGDQRKQR